jgi:hypothetical protein
MERENTVEGLFWTMTYHGGVEPLLGVGPWGWMTGGDFSRNLDDTLSYWSRGY